MRTTPLTFSNRCLIMQNTPKQSLMQTSIIHGPFTFSFSPHGADGGNTSLSVMLHRNQYDSCYINMEMFFSKAQRAGLFHL